MAEDEEYYIQRPDDEGARGPFNLEQLQTLAEAEQLDEQTYFFNEESQGWETFAEHPDLMGKIRPARKTIRLRKREPAEEKETADQPDDAPKESTNQLGVDEFLAAAEGQTDETRHLKEREKEALKAASLSPTLIATVLLVSAVALWGPQMEWFLKAFEKGDYAALLAEPIFVVGLLDIIVAILSFLGVTEIYPLVRLRASLGLGYFGYFFWAIGNPVGALAAVIGSIGLYVSTATLRLPILLGASAVGIVGMVVLALAGFQLLG